MYKLHPQLLNIYEKNERYLGSKYKKQMFMFAEDKVQRIFVLNQLLKIHENTR